MLQAKYGAIRFCPDEWMEALGVTLWDEAMRAKIESLQWQLTQELLVLGQTVIIEWGTWGRSERDVLRTGATAIGAAVELHYLSAPIDVLFERVQHRSLENPPIRKEQLVEWAAIIEAPSTDEMALFDEAFVVET